LGGDWDTVETEFQNLEGLEWQGKKYMYTPARHVN
jgi:hypothetical protein